MLKKISLIILCGAMTFCLTGCGKEKEQVVDFIGTWNYDGAKIEITKDKVIIGEESHSYEQKGNWLFLKVEDDPSNPYDDGASLYFVDNKHVVVVQGGVMWK